MKRSRQRGNARPVFVRELDG
uniref:Uncharacterized protein n=1 Tax=Anguilla anguilla TaxID=7936 RepID=A0A0E9V5S7_ANGAN